MPVLHYTSKLFQRLYAQAYLDLVNHASELLGWLYDYLDRPWKHERLRLAFDRLNTRPLVKLVEAARPDWIVCTHFLPAEIVSWLRGQAHLAARHAVVVTDLDVQAMWLARHVDRYFVTLEETRAHLERLGVPAERIAVSGIPIDPIFAEPKEAGTMREKHGSTLTGRRSWCPPAGSGSGRSSGWCGRSWNSGTGRRSSSSAGGVRS